MATAATQQALGNSTLDQVIEPLAQETKPAKHNVIAELIYHKDDGSRIDPYYVGSEVIPARPTTPRNVTFYDVSGDESNFTLDGQGFQFAKHKSKLQGDDFRDEEKIKNEYYPEVEQLVKDVTGATRVVIFNHATRLSPKDGPNGPGPGKKVHIDQSYQTAINTVKYILPDEADELLKKRFQIINIWRPIKTILRDPFAVADASTVPDSDLVAAARVYPDRTDETWMVKANPDHRWYFKYAQQPDEPLLFKCYDSFEDRARRNPHSAFWNPAHGLDEPVRESVDVRTLVFYDY